MSEFRRSWQEIIDLLGLEPHPEEGGYFALLGTTMAPGFDYADWEGGTPELIERYPERRELIEHLLPPTGSHRPDDDTNTGVGES